MPDLQEDTVKHLLERTFLFGQASGQYVNPAKSSAVPLYGLSVPATPVAGVTVLCLAGVVFHWHMIDWYMVSLCLA
jgi:hypothetical protein